MRFGDAAFGLGFNLIDTYLFATALKRDHFPVGRKMRRVVA
jgi:hypothetical protein